LPTTLWSNQKTTPIYQLYLFLFLLLITSNGCLTPLLQDDFDSHSPNIINTNLVGSIPSGPDGDRISYVLPTVISVQEPQLTQQSLRINNRVDFQLKAHDSFNRYNGTPPQFSFQTNAVHQFAVVLIVQGTNGSTSYADITVSEGDGDSQEWGQMPLLGNQLETLKTVRFRSADNSPYTLDNLAANAN